MSGLNGRLNGLTNAHTHTSYCDGANTPAEMAARARELGFYALGFSGHSLAPDYYFADGFGMQPGDLAAYKRDVLAERERYAGRMAVYLGLELDAMSDVPTPGEFDYIIGSVHNMTAPDGGILPVDMSPSVTRRAIANLYGGDVWAYVADYFAEVDRMLSARRVDICGHFDLICKYNAGGAIFDENDLRYRDMAAAVLQKHAGKCVFEINTGAMARGVQTRPYPDYWLWEILRDAGTPVMVNSDSHSVATLDFALREQTERARKFGLKLVDICEICG